MSTHPLIPAKPAVITLDTLPQLFAYNRAKFGGWSMDGSDPVRPDDIPEETWDALGDPGKQALTREREARQSAERALAAARAKPAPPKPTVKPDEPAKSEAKADDQPDIAAIVKQAVDAAIKPFAEKDQQREAQSAAEKVRDAVKAAAKGRLHDESDGLMIDLAAVVAEDGTPDAEKIKTALDTLIETKPHLAKDTRRFAAPGVGPTATGGAVPMKEQVQSVLAQMQASTGVRIPRSE